MLKALIVLATQRCDLTCAHCLGGPAAKIDFPLDLYDRLLREARPFGARLISFTGGEPRLHPGFDEMLRLTVQAGYTGNIASNEQNAAALLALLEKYGEQNRGLVLSLDGATSEMHDLIRQKAGAFAQLENTARKLVAAGYKVKASTCLNQKNKAQLDEIVKLCIRLEKVEHFSVNFSGTQPKFTLCMYGISQSWNLHMVEMFKKTRFSFFGISVQPFYA